MYPSLVKHELGLYARRFCSAYYVSGRTPSDFRRQSGPPAEVREQVRFHLDERRQRVSASFQGFTRVAQYCGGQGSVILPIGYESVCFKPVPVDSSLPPADDLDWPMGDRSDPHDSRSRLDRAAVQKAIGIAFDSPDDQTAAVVVLHNGVIVGERYADGVARDTQLESWSMGKSLLATLFATLVKDGTYSLDQAAPIPEWQSPRGPRSRILIRDLLNMSSGLRFSSSFDEGYSWQSGYPDHLLGYSDSIDAYGFARMAELEVPAPVKRGRYRNCDCWLLGWLIKSEMERRGEEVLTFPQRALFDKIGIRRQVLETDTFGNLLYSGCDYGTARNWARIGLLHLQKGVWNGEQILPESWTDFVSAPAPHWPKRVHGDFEYDQYGAMFWLNTTGALGVPKDTYSAAGAGEQLTYIIPSYNMVVVRMGHHSSPSGICPMPVGSVQPTEVLTSTERMLKELMQVVAADC